MELTSEQTAILETTAADVAVSADAGSGKTFVLVERYLRLLEHRRIPEIAAVTFTEAAATECASASAGPSRSGRRWRRIAATSMTR